MRECCRNRIIAILRRFLIKEFGIISRLYFSGQGFVAGDIGILSADTGEADHLVQQIIIDSRAENSAVRLAGRILGMDQSCDSGGMHQSPYWSFVMI